jgi:hypothetical protein
MTISPRDERAMRRGEVAHHLASESELSAILQKPWRGQAEKLKPSHRRILDQFEERSGHLQRQSLADYPEAVCNDNSSAAYYFSASPSGSDEWVIYLQGVRHCCPFLSLHARSDALPDRACGAGRPPLARSAGRLDRTR